MLKNLKLTELSYIYKNLVKIILSFNFFSVRISRIKIYIKIYFYKDIRIWPIDSHNYKISTTFQRKLQQLLNKKQLKKTTSQKNKTKNQRSLNKKNLKLMLKKKSNNQKKLLLPLKNISLLKVTINLKLKKSKKLRSTKKV